MNAPFPRARVRAHHLICCAQPSGRITMRPYMGPQSRRLVVIFG